MAGDRSSNGPGDGSGEPFELEVKRKEDGSWHPCRVSLSSSDASSGVVLNFEGCDDEGIISSREDMLKYLRFRSIPLQSGDCTYIKEGDYVLAMNKNQSKSLYFDAVVQKVYRIRHSKRVFCRCTFDVKWLTPNSKEITAALPSKSIMRLCDRHIESHPVLAGFLSACKTLGGAEAPSFHTMLEESTFESNFLAMLEKQVEEISKLADGSQLSEDLLCGSNEASLKSQESCRRSTRSQAEEKVKVECVKHLDYAPILSPLAVHAAVVSSLNGQSKVELPIFQSQDKGQLDLALKGVCFEQFPDVQDTVVMSDACTLEDLDELPNLDLVSNNGGLVEANDLTRSSATGLLASKDSPNSVTSQGIPALSLECAEINSVSVVKHSAKPITNEKLNGHSTSSRLTRSAAKKQTPSSAAQVDVDSLDHNPMKILSTRLMCPEQNIEQLNGQRVTARVTRSAAKKKSPSAASQVDVDSLDENLKSFVSQMLMCPKQTSEKLNGHSIAAPVTRAAAKKQTLSSGALVNVESLDENLKSHVGIGLMGSEQKREQLNGGHSIIARVTRSAAKKQIPSPATPIDVESLDENIKSTLTTRLHCDEQKRENSIGHSITDRVTRSAAKKQILSSADQVGKDSNEKRSKERDYIHTSEKNENKKRMSVCTTADASTNVSKEPKTMNSKSSVALTEEHQGISSQDGESLPAKRNKASSMKPTSRPSPRVRFLSRTRSGAKSSAA